MHMSSSWTDCFEVRGHGKRDLYGWNVKIMFLRVKLVHFPMPPHICLTTEVTQIKSILSKVPRIFSANALRVTPVAYAFPKEEDYVFFHYSLIGQFLWLLFCVN